MRTEPCLEGLRGSIRRNISLAPYTWFRVGGPAQMLFIPEDEADLALFLRRCKGLVLGAGSNLLVRDGGVEQPVIKLGKGFHQFLVEYEEIEVGAGLPDRIVAERCQALGLSGLEFLFTIPGTIGGALKMNAGCYGAEIADRLVYAKALDPQGIKHTLSVKELRYGYRHCELPEGWVFLGARFRGINSTPAAVAKTMMSFAEQREETQPTHVRTGGSTFANPQGHKAWQLIEGIGYRGKKRGGASVSAKHCNFLVNEGTATAADIEGLGEDIRAKVWQHYAVQLEWEIVRWGS